MLTIFGNLKVDTNLPDSYTLAEPCKYSFHDLLREAGMPSDTNNLYRLTQEERNNEVKMLCKVAGWYWKDVESEGKIYTAFSKNCRKII